MAFFKLKPDKTKPNIKPSMFVALAAILLTIYGFLLVLPFSSAFFQYPYYRVFCGKKPVIADNGYLSKSYATPDMKSYRLDGSSQVLYCTELEAMSYGHNKRPL